MYSSVWRLISRICVHLVIPYEFINLFSKTIQSELIIECTSCVVFLAIYPQLGFIASHLLSTNLGTHSPWPLHACFVPTSYVKIHHTQLSGQANFKSPAMILLPVSKLSCMLYTFHCEQIANKEWPICSWVHQQVASHMSFNSFPATVLCGYTTPQLLLVQSSLVWDLWNGSETKPESGGGWEGYTGHTALGCMYVSYSILSSTVWVAMEAILLVRGQMFLQLRTNQNH